MGLSITSNYFNSFEGRERNQSRQELKKTAEKPKEVSSDKSVFNYSANFGVNAQLSLIKADKQINMNEKLSETLKYLRTHASEKSTKTPVFGELWKKFCENGGEYNGEIIDIEIDMNEKNIFAAA